MYCFTVFLYGNMVQRDTVLICLDFRKSTCMNMIRNCKSKIDFKPKILLISLKIINLELYTYV